jgi:hypothetical protein
LVSALLNLSENTNRVLNIIKMKYQLKDKSQAVEHLVDKYIEDSEDRELRPEFIQEILEASKEKGILVKTSLAERYGQKNVRKGNKGKAR